MLAKVYAQNGSEDVSAIREVINTAAQAYVILGVNGGGIAEIFYEKELEKATRRKFKVEKIFKRKDDGLYVKWESHDNSLNSGIENKDASFQHKFFFQKNILVVKQTNKKKN